MSKFKPAKPYTKKQFEKLLTKASQPVSEWNKPDSKDSKTSVVHPSDGYTEKHKNQDNPEGKED